MKIPVFHDDQHGTAIIVGAAITNALLLNGKKLEDVKIVASGAGRRGDRLPQSAGLAGRAAQEYLGLRYRRRGA